MLWLSIVVAVLNAFRGRTELRDVATSNAYHRNTVGVFGIRRLSALFRVACLPVHADSPYRVVTVGVLVLVVCCLEAPQGQAEGHPLCLNALEDGHKPR